MSKIKITPVIMAGGKGTRLWPVSRLPMPKQFCKLGDELSLFQKTLNRICDHEMFSEPIILTNASHLATVKMQMQAIGFSTRRIICEPCGRDTAAAVDLCLVDPLTREDDVLLVMPADHMIEEAGRFHEAVEEAAQIAVGANTILTFGIKPTEPATGYGYLKAGENVSDSSAKYLNAFIEKPDFENAERLIRQKNVYWNAGIFLFTAGVMKSEFEKYASVLHHHVNMAVRHAAVSGDIIFPDQTHFEKIEGISIDYAVMEKTERAALIPIDPKWCDVGCWDAVWTASERDGEANVICGNVIAQNIENSYVRSDGPTVAISDVEDIIVVADKDAILITARGKSQCVKSLTDKVEQVKPELLKQQAGEERPWGEFNSIHRGETHQAKSIVVKPGGQLSLQYHFHRSEHWVVVRGIATVTVGEEILQLTPGQHVYIPQGSLHRLENHTDDPVEIIEVQYGTYLGEDDIVRVEDVYDRPETETSKVA